MEEDNKNQFIAEVVDLIYKILYQKISTEELNTMNDDIKLTVGKFLDNKPNYKISSALKRKLIRTGLKELTEFDLINFLNKPDYDYYFPHECPYNQKQYKAALGYITKSKAIYCDVPPGSNHADVVTEMHRMIDSEYEDLRFYYQNHGNDINDSDWHNKVMNEEGCIVIHFVPNIYGEVIYIPKEINDFQYQELLKINKILKERKISAETNKNIELTEYLKELENNRIKK